MIGHFEIPVTDLERARAFYEHIFQVEMSTSEVHGHPMAFFPETTAPGRISGGLAQGAPYAPADAGPLIYFAVESIDEALQRITEGGCEIVFPKTSAGDFGFVAEFIDCEGNRIALMEQNPAT